MMPASNAGVGMNMGFPDTCLTPAAPSPIPVPYPNMGMNSQELPPAGGGRILISGCPGHNMGGKPVMTTGDEGGTAHPMFKMPGGCIVGNPKILLGGMPAEHLATPSYGNNYNDGLGAKLVPSVTNVLLTGLGASLVDHAGHSRWTPADRQLLAAELLDRPLPSLGLSLRSTPGGAEVAHVRAGGLAARLGVRSGDLLTHIDGHDPARVQGLRLGATTRLGLQRGRRRFTRSGRLRAVAAVSGTLGLDGVGLLRLRRCALTAPAQVRALLAAWSTRGLQRVRLDLRGNPGGCLRSAARVAGALLGPDQVVAHVHDGHAWETLTSGSARAMWTGPLEVWIDGGTASAAESLAAALRDHGRGTLRGTPTFGKGTGEQLVLDHGSAVPTHRRLRVARIDGRPLARVDPTEAA